MLLLVGWLKLAKWCWCVDLNGGWCTAGKLYRSGETKKQSEVVTKYCAWDSIGKERGEEEEEMVAWREVPRVRDGMGVKASRVQVNTTRTRAWRPKTSTSTFNKFPSILNYSPHYIYVTQRPAAVRGLCVSVSSRHTKAKKKTPPSLFDFLLEP